MTGHIRRRGARSWELKFDAGNDAVTGKRKIRYNSFKGTERQARNELVRLIAEHDAGNSVDRSKVTVAEFLATWDRDTASLRVTPKTLERYRQIIKNQIAPNIGQIEIQKLRPSHLKELYAKLVRSGREVRQHNRLAADLVRRPAEQDDDRGLSARTVDHVHRLLHQALRSAQTSGIVQQNVAAALPAKERPKIASQEITILPQDQIGRVLKHLEGRTMRPIIALALATGARRGELLALRIKDFNPAAGSIRIERSLEQTKAGLRFKSPKTRNGRRTIALPASIIVELRAHLLKQKERRLALGMGRPSGDDLLFARWDGSTRSPHWLTQKFAQAMSTLKIKDVTLHSLRHSHASHLIASGMDILTISRRLGHANPSITLTVYGHLVSGTDARAAEIMELAFAKVRT